MSSEYLEFLEQIVKEDVEGLNKAQQQYGDSWKKRSGIGAYMMACRKFDRLEIQAEKYSWDIFEAIQKDERSEGAIDDIRDLRRYLILIEAEMRVRGAVSALSQHRDNEPADIGRHDNLTIKPSDFLIGSSGMEHPFGYDRELDDK